jgi:hypothetical protein
MAIIKRHEIVGYSIEHETVCAECANAEEIADLKLSDLIMSDEITNLDSNDQELYCDRCEERIREV